MEKRYSIDKIKLLLYGVKINVVQKLMHDLLLDMNCKAFESYKITSCRYNYTIELEGEGVIYIGIEPNWLKETNKNYKYVVIEYNPNKLNLPCWISNIIIPTKTEILSVDVAVDIPIDIQEIMVLKRHGLEYEATISKGSLETLYLGRFGSNGHIKIYDKAKEQKDKSKVLTRFEISYKKIGFLDLIDYEIIKQTKLPVLLIKSSCEYNKNCTPTDRYLLASMERCKDLLHLLDRRKLKQLRQYQKEQKQHIDISIDKIINCIKEFMNEF